MEKKTKETYKKEILKKYKLEKTRELSPYLFDPTPGLIKEACEVVFEKRKADNDIRILKNFFRPKENEDILLAIHRIETTKFKPVISFLKEDTKDPKTSTLELISWLVDYNPRPFFEYLKKGNTDESGDLPGDIFNEMNQKNEGSTSPSTYGAKVEKVGAEKRDEITSTQKEEENTKGKKRRWIITFSISIVFAATLMVVKNGMFDKPIVPKESKEHRCMVWAKNHYVEVSCDLTFHKKYRTKVEDYDPKLIANFKKVEVTMKTDFFVEGTNKPLIWYTKSKDGKIEYFTSPGLHPVTGKTLDEITPYIIQKYVPLHSGNINSFVD